MQSAHIIEEILAAAKLQLPKNQRVSASVFIREFYADVVFSDFAKRTMEDWCAAVLFNWRWLYERKHQRKLTVINPDWDCPNTVIALIQKDMPFLVDSLKMELNRLGCEVKLVIHLGGIKIERHNGRVIEVTPVKEQGSNEFAEAPIYIEINRQDHSKLAKIRRDLERILDDVNIVFQDCQKMLGQINTVIHGLESAVHYDDKAEVLAFLRWLVDGNFNFLGYGYYQADKQKNLQLNSASKLGILRNSKIVCSHIDLHSFPSQLRDAITSKQLILLRKSSILSTVHCAHYFDMVEIKNFDTRGRLVGMHVFCGLYGTMAYHSSIRRIPILRDKTTKILERFGYPLNGYAAKALLSVLEELPRDDFIQSDLDELYRISVGIFHLQGKRLTKLFVFSGMCNGYVSCLVYVPKENFNTVLRLRVQEILMRAFAGVSAEFEISFTDPVLARIHFIIRFKEASKPNLPALEQEIIKASRSWYDELQGLLAQDKLIAGTKYSAVFPAGYCELFTPEMAAVDIAHIEQLTAAQPLAINFYLQDADRQMLGIKLFSLKMLQLSDVLPVLENMGLKVISEQAYELQLNAAQKIWLNYLQVIFMSGELALAAVKEKFINVVEQALNGTIENDGFNRLVLSAGLTGREVEIFRAYAKYLLQIKFPFSQQYMELVLARQAQITQALLQTFVYRFNPALQNQTQEKLATFAVTIDKLLDAVTNLEEDRILRQFYALLQATVRTNYYCEQPYLVFKFNCQCVPSLPLPCPLFEIFVYAVRFEAVHLRMARVARGGIRWSDRRDDFRTEILGLMKAQQVKNVVIVPYGAKGGFVLKRVKDDPKKEAVACYQDFIRGLLSVTDNIVDGRIVAPMKVVCHDEVDPYLVVAADKGTANFSDLANSVSQGCNFWLDDAFASGGKTGYNHKDIGITARGVWESVKLHFENLGITRDFTVVGIGDMSGDVFGNGMLLSRQIKLIAAFDHRHIFLDPNPDTLASYRERKRLFKLAHSSWEDYDKKLISKGGGIYPRTLKSIAISAEMQKVLQVKKSVFTPYELISAILQAPVDLLWNGGIGTYVKASSETHAEVGDKTNDSLRVNGCDLRCKVVAEGGNLGLTQLGRVEYALRGGRINTDFVDNSGGVNCSDHEVNIKILLNELIRQNKLKAKQRNALLRSMTNEVADLVLQNNALQARAIDLITSQTPKNLGLLSEYLSTCEKQGKINRALEFLPSDRTLIERKTQRLGLTSPEVAILFAYSKIILKEKILHSKIPDMPYFAGFLRLAFPLKLQGFSKQFVHHRLRREIISTELSNDFTTMLGMAFIFELQKEMEVTITDILSAYVIALDVFAVKSWLRDLERLTHINPEIKKRLMLGLSSILRRAIKWLLRNCAKPLAIETVIKDIKNSVNAISKNWARLVVGQEKKMLQERLDGLLAAKVPYSLARILVLSHMTDSILNIANIVADKKTTLEKAAHVYFMLRDKLELFWLFGELSSHVPSNNWEVMAKNNLRNDLDQQQRRFTLAILRFNKKGDIYSIFNTWLSKNAAFYESWQQTLFAIKQADSLEFAIIYMVGMELLALTKKF